MRLKKGGMFSFNKSPPSPPPPTRTPLDNYLTLIGENTWLGGIRNKFRVDTLQRFEMVGDKVDNSFVKGSVVKEIDLIIDNDRYSLTGFGNMHEFVNTLTREDIESILSGIEKGDALFKNFDRYMFLRLLFVEGNDIIYCAPLLSKMLHSGKGVSKNELDAWIIDSAANLADPDPSKKPPWTRVNFISTFFRIKNFLFQNEKDTYLELEKNAADAAAEAAAGAKASAAAMSSAD
jgi:hypothetical protein